LEEVFDYYKLKANKKIASRIINGIVNQTTTLEKQPEIGQIENILENDEREFRYLVYTNYKILYYINKNTHRVVIASVFDTRQNPEMIIDL
jgi:plasmid stabilization system protein ParE